MVNYLVIIHPSIQCFHGYLKFVWMKIKTKIKVVLDVMLRSMLEIYQRLGVTWGLQRAGQLPPQYFSYLRIFLATDLERF